MSKLLFNKLYIFSSPDKTARVIEFAAGKTIITSSSIDGTNRGKSVIMKSLYHTMGADCNFDDKWDDNSKIYILNFTVDGNEFYIFRHSSLFKIFDADKNIIFKTLSRHELSERLNDIFHFAVKLPARQNSSSDLSEEDEKVQRLEITPPAYNYLLYFVDQDGQRGSQFSSFRSLQQYPDFKINTLYYHFGTFDDDYYDLTIQQEKLIEQQKRIIRDNEMMQLMLDRVYANINDVSYSKDIEHLRRDVDRTKAQYNEIAQKLSEIRNKLVTLRNDKEELLLHISSLSGLTKENDKQIQSLNDHICPLCSSCLDNPLPLRIKRYNTGDDIILLSGELQIDVQRIERNIAKQEIEYTEWLSKLNEYESAFNLHSSEINDVLRHKGYIEIKEKMSDDLHALREQAEQIEARLKDINKKLQKYNDAKKKINTRYYELMLADKNRFELDGIAPKTFENIKKSFSSGGSNNPIATIVWYANLLKLKHEFNPDAIDFPVVLDSPNNAETDQEKKNQVYQYICERVTDNQLIVSGIGFLDMQIQDVEFDKVIELNNPKYSLLLEKDYTENIGILNELNSK